MELFCSNLAAFFPHSWGFFLNNNFKICYRLILKGERGGEERHGFVAPPAHAPLGWPSCAPCVRPSALACQTLRPTAPPGRGHIWGLVVVVVVVFTAYLRHSLPLHSSQGISSTACPLFLKIFTSSLWQPSDSCLYLWEYFHSVLFICGFLDSTYK